MTTALWRTRLLKLAYAAVFVALLPVLLALWAARLDQWVSLPVPSWPATGAVLVAAGAAFMVAGTLALWQYGHGLPMSAFPPERLVARGVYRFVADPLYVGAVTMALGVSLVFASPAGLWIVSPMLALSCVAWVMGFERERTRQRFGTVAIPLLQLPPDSDDAPTPWHRAAVFAFVLIPWLVLYQAVEYLGAPADAASSMGRIDAAIPVIPWTESLYVLVYPMVALAPCLARSQRHLRRFARRGLWATAGIILYYLVFPVVAQPKPIPGEGFWQTLIEAERYGDAPITAFPAFHVTWACLAASMYASTWQAGRWAWLLALGSAVGCVTVGVHSVADVAAGLLAFVIVASGDAMWASIRRWAEHGANSWREWSIGPLRLMSHGLYAGLAAFVGLPIAVWLAGPDLLWWVFAATMVGAVAAALWAQGVEGSPQLLRPFGYFGGVLGVLVTVIVAAVAGVDAWRLMAAYLVALAFGQGLGRLRCLVNGCCHGHATRESIGIRYVHRSTRPTRLAHLDGVPIHPTQVYSLVWLVVVGLVLARLWLTAQPIGFIAGMYFVLVGLGRFVEEHFRGEPQTRVIGGLRLYQWIALAFVVGGAALSTVRTAAAPAPAPIGWPTLGVALVTALVGTACFGLDSPTSHRRYSRLA